MKGCKMKGCKNWVVSTAIAVLLSTNAVAQESDYYEDPYLYEDELYECLYDECLTPMDDTFEVIDTEIVPETHTYPEDEYLEDEYFVDITLPSLPGITPEVPSSTSEIDPPVGSLCTMYYFGSHLCSPCIALKPKVDALAQLFPKVHYQYFGAGTEGTAAIFQRYRITNYPGVLIYKKVGNTMQQIYRSDGFQGVPHDQPNAVATWANNKEQAIDAVLKQHCQPQAEAPESTTDMDT